MGTDEATNEYDRLCEEALRESLAADKKAANIGLDFDDFKEFFRLTGGSLFYCLSAVFTTYGIVKVMGPILTNSNSLADAIPCILTLGVYELALLGVLILIVSRKVIDDAVSLTILIALFLVGTSMALGSVADRDIGAAGWIGLIGVALSLCKLGVMRRFAGIPVRLLSFLGLGIIIACNYFGPAILARSIIEDPLQEWARREIWLFIWVAMLAGVGAVVIEAMKGKPTGQEGEEVKTPFLRRPVMVYVFALVVAAASGLHQYSMAFTFALERTIGDFVPLVLVGTLLVIEILRHWGRRLGFLEMVIACIPLAVMLVAVKERSVASSGEFGVGLICYPPVALGLCGLAIGGLAIYHRWHGLLAVVAIYGLGVILTLDYSPEYPHDLNAGACIAILVAALLIYGAIIRNQYVCLAGVIFLCAGLSVWDPFRLFMADYGVSEASGLAGVAGVGSLVLYLIFAGATHKAVGIAGSICLAGFIFDYLPEQIHFRYAIVLLCAGTLTVVLWFRARDVLAMSILWVPSVVRLYMITRYISHWRSVIVGFLLLGIGAMVSLLKRPAKAETEAAD